ncbi:molybdenum ABC transporter ATP-binding protein [Rhodobacteraceae bacterium N5(2021)]|uniref:Molybdenum ABC transporter ATP-binding protein n=1 Tax=Gymnodinialimonas phycosphaerae TaxID=2841589 RepID=A0A975TWM0_9RHOB|nr:molybdenum ABC transporter ATP-binding protein [Gymnodinialimonas phycosphaerae]MBY4892318.1 molybdenum ABC transporter ATP-binding protein [Gymnodinialimonas phycosphaerae]
MLEVRVKHDFPGFALDVAFEAPMGVTALFGRSGAGKTSVVRTVAGVLKADEALVRVGDLRLDGLSVPARRIGYVFQEPRLFPHMSVRANLAYGMRGGDMDAVVKMLGIAALLDRRPGALSGGEAQRVAIGRALLSQPRLLLLDEPLAALDEARKAEILPYIERLRDEVGVPILYVSHSVAEIARLATTVVALEAGRVVRVGAAADVLSDPDVVPVLGVREAGALVTARIEAHHEDGLTALTWSAGTLLLPHVARPVGAEVRVRIEAQDVMLAATRPEGISALNVVPVTLTALRDGEGPGTIVQLRAGDDLILARVTRRSATAMGLVEGWQGYAVVKSVAVAAGNVAASFPVL